MVEEGYITAAEADEAKEEDLNIVVKRANINAPHFVDYIREVLVDKYGIKQVETGGLKVITTLDWQNQQTAEEVTT